MKLGKTAVRLYRLLCVVIIAYETYMYLTAETLTRIPLFESLYLLLLGSVLILHTYHFYALIGVALFNAWYIQPIEDVARKISFLKVDSVLCIVIIFLAFVSSLRGEYTRKSVGVQDENHV